jgi:hypothetical protein
MREIKQNERPRTDSRIVVNPPQNHDVNSLSSSLQDRTDVNNFTLRGFLFEMLMLDIEFQTVIPLTHAERQEAVNKMVMAH